MVFMPKANVAVTIRSFDYTGSAYDILTSRFNTVYTNRSRRRLSEDELIHAICEVRGVIAGTESFSSQVISSSPDLAVISRVGVGTDTIDMAAARNAGIKVMTTPQSPVFAVAEHTIGLILAVQKKIPAYNHAVHEGDFSVQPGSMLKGKTVGIIGMGRIGQQVAALLDAFGCTIIYYDPFASPDVKHSWKKTASLDELIRMADIISLHAPAQQGNRPLLDQERLSQCKKGVVIINTARGSLIDDVALANALKKGFVKGAGLDVFVKEPYAGPLLDYPTVIMTPHVASNTTESRADMEMEAVTNLIQSLEGKDP
jgi:D-3-phosphoglycerate dehydrogenase